MTDTIPVLEAEIIDGQARVWCDYCRKFHYHAAVDGHRIAHCTKKGSPYKTTGYTIKIVGLA